MTSRSLADRAANADDIGLKRSQHLGMVVDVLDIDNVHPAAGNKQLPSPTKLLRRFSQSGTFGSRGLNCDKPRNKP